MLLPVEPFQGDASMIGVQAQKGKGIEASQRLEYRLEGQTHLLEEFDVRRSVFSQLLLEVVDDVGHTLSKNTCNRGFSSLGSTPSAGGEGRREVEGTSSSLECMVAKLAAAPRRRRPGLRLVRRSARSSSGVLAT